MLKLVFVWNIKAVLRECGISSLKISVAVLLCSCGGSFIYFIVSGEISVYLVKIKVVSITSEVISYLFTSD